MAPRFGLSIVVGLALVTTPLLGQEPTPPGFQAYRLEHLDAGKAASHLKSLTAAVDPAVEILLDRSLNRVLVKGSPETHRLAHELLSTLDQPPDKAPAAAKGDAAVLKGYPVPAERLEATARRLEEKYPPAVKIRVAADARTSQILVFAPPAVQAEISRELLAAATDPPEAEGALQPPSAPGGGPTAAPGGAGQAYSFRHKSWREIEDLLRQTWGGQLTEQLQRNGELAVFRLTTSSGGEAVIAIDRRNEIAQVQGPPHLTAAALRVLQALDAPPATAQSATQLVSVRNAKPEPMRRAAELLQAASRSAGQRAEAVAAPPAQRNQPRWAGDLLTMIFQQAQDGQADGAQANQPQPNLQPGPQPQQPGGQFQPPGGQAQLGLQPEPPGVQLPPGQEQPGQALVPLTPPADEEGGFFGPVQIEFVEGLDAVIIRGHPRDVERVRRIIQQIQEQARLTAPAVEIYYLRYVNSEAMATLVNAIYTAVFAPRQGNVNVTALVQPNALLIVGPPENVNSALELVRQLDQPLRPGDEFEVFMLEHASAAEVERVLKNFYNEGQALPTGAAAVGAAPGQAQVRPGLGTRPRIVSDYRSNAVIVMASPRELEEIRRLIERLDVATISSAMEIRVFPLRNSLADQLAPVLQEAITGRPEGQLAQQIPQQQVPGQAGQVGLIRSRMLYLVTIDKAGDRLLESGVLTDVTVVADPRANTLIVTAPDESMELIAALIRELDELPAIEAQVKVFTILNGDAQALADMLQQLFGQQQAQQAGQLAVQTAAGQGESTLVPLRFAVDPRTNSIIATGSAGDLNVVEAILLRLDVSDIQQRRTRVFRLRYAYALNVADAINQLLTAERQILLQQQGVLSPFEQIQREVVVVPEIVTNSLIVSSTPRFYDEVVQIVEDLDRRPPMVVIQVMIAEVLLNNIDEFGTEFGLQDSLLFSRGATQTFNMEGDPTGVTSLNPGFNFNNAPLPNENSAGRENLAGQALTSFALGRIGTPGYGGLVLSASNESISILLRALQEDGRARILSRPQIMTLDNIGAFIQRGSRVPFPGQQTVGAGGQVTVTTNFENVGLLLGVTPRVTPDGLVVMEVDAENSVIADFIPIGEGAVAPQIDLSLAQTTVSARSGQTVILGGIIATSKIFESRRVPYLSDLPLMGRLFRFESQTEERRELLIILTPWVVTNEYEMEQIKQMEFARMNWCLADVVGIHGDIGGSTGAILSDAHVIFPDLEPTAAEIVPIPEPQYGLPGVESAAPQVGPPLGTAPIPPGGRPQPTPAPPPGELPLAPPGPMGGPFPPDASPGDSSRRMQHAYLPSPGYPVAPVMHQQPIGRAPIMR